MFALYEDQRQQLLRLSIMLVCGGLAVLPLTVPPISVDLQAQTAAHYGQVTLPPVPERLLFPVIAIRRDPFVADAGALPAAQSSAGSGLTVHQGDDVGIVLPPNAGALDGAARYSPSGDGAIVRGVVLGKDPEALIDIGSGVKVFGIGDAVGSDSIRAIDASGVRLSSGMLLKIESAKS